MVWNSKRDKVWFAAVVAFLGVLTFTTNSFAGPKAWQYDTLSSHVPLRITWQIALSRVDNGEPNDPVAMAFYRTFGASVSCNDPVAMAFYRALGASCQ